MCSNTSLILTVLLLIWQIQAIPVFWDAFHRLDETDHLKHYHPDNHGNLNSNGEAVSGGHNTLDEIHPQHRAAALNGRLNPVSDHLESLSTAHSSSSMSRSRTRLALPRLYEGYKPDIKYSQVTYSGAYVEDAKLDKKDIPGAYVV
jgi:hypothetical protein